MTTEKREGANPRADETTRRDAVRDQDPVERARGGRQSPAEQRKDDLLPGRRAWRTDHTEIMLVEPPDSEESSEESEVYLRVTDITNSRYVQAPLTADDLEIVAHILQLHAGRLRRLAERR